MTREKMEIGIAGRKNAHKPRREERVANKGKTALADGKPKRKSFFRRGNNEVE